MGAVFLPSLVGQSEEIVSWLGTVESDVPSGMVWVLAPALFGFSLVSLGCPRVLPAR